MSVPKIILISAVLIILDLFVYVALGMLLMNYDDFYDESKGEYWSLKSMTLSEKVHIHWLGGLAYLELARRGVHHLSDRRFF